MVETRRFVFSNFARSVLAEGVSAGATQVRVIEGAGSKFPLPDGTYDEIFSALLVEGASREIIYCTARSTDVMTVERGKEGTVSQAFLSGATCVHVPTAAFFEQVGEVIAPSLSGEFDSTYDEVSLFWTVPPQAIEGYSLERSVDNGAFTLLESLGEVSVYTDDDIAPPSHYSYRIKAISATELADSDYSNTVSFDSAFLETFMLLHVEGGELFEVTGFPDVDAVTNNGSAVSEVQAKFGAQSFHNVGTSSEGQNFIRVNGGATDFVFPGEFTWEGWFYFTANPNSSFENIFSNNINFPSTGFLQVARWNGGSRNLMMNTSAGGVSLTANSVPLNQWVHIAVTRNGANQVHFWLNGVDIGSGDGITGTVGGDIAGVTSFDIGRGIASDNGDALMFFEEIRVTKACRYTANFTPPTAPFPPFPGN